MSMTISPDERYIASVAGAGLYLIPVGGGTVREVLHAKPREAFDGYRAAWTPDGQSLLLPKRIDNQALELWMVPMFDRREPRKMDVDTEAWALAGGGFAIHPSGRLIAFTGVAGKQGAEVGAGEPPLGWARDKADHSVGQCAPDSVPAVVAVSIAVGSIPLKSQAAIGPLLTIPLGLDLYMPVPEDNPITADKVDLGRRLFNDRRLSRDVRSRAFPVTTRSRVLDSRRDLSRRLRTPRQAQRCGARQPRVGAFVFLGRPRRDARRASAETDRGSQ